MIEVTELSRTALVWSVCTIAALMLPRTVNAEPTGAAKVVFCCQPQNDLYRVLAATLRNLPRFDTPAEAIGRATEGSGVLILADGYPHKTTVIDASLIETATSKNMRLYVEFPEALPGLETATPRTTQWERAVVASEFFGPSLKPMTILAIHDCHYVPIKAERSHIVTARVAGFDAAIFGLPKETQPILWEHPSGRLLVSTTKLSQFLTARYGPTQAWRTIWQRILEWAAKDSPTECPMWTPTVRPSFCETEPLPTDVEAQSVRRGALWYVRSRVLVHPSREAAITRRLSERNDDERYNAGWMEVEADRFSTARMPVGDGSRGILEGFSSRIRFDGTQDQRLVHRGDCHGESAMGLAFGGELAGDPNLGRIAGNILDFYYFTSIARKGARADPNHPAYGLVAWGVTNWDWEKAFYGDDNARLMLGTIATASLLRTDRWDEPVLRCLLGNLRTTGRLGFRTDRIDLPDLAKNGWHHYFDASPINCAPHYEAYLWACYLWAYRHTGYEPFLARAESAIRRTMDAYPDRWRWTVGVPSDQGRMLLPLAWLVRVKDTPEHRQWLRRMAEDLTKRQVASGALREELATVGRTDLAPPRSNEDYGKNEAMLLQRNGDAVSDMLYTCNFALLGLHEAAAATGERLFVDAEDKLARFLCRIQVRSEVRPELDGAWFRGFDFGRWEYWASSADVGWGAWCIETGWSQGWIVSVLGMRQLKTSLWDLTAGSRIAAPLPKLLPLMMSTR